MLKQSDNELLSRTGPGTPMGELFRRYWLPAVLTADLPEPDGAPVRLRILSEDLVAFRDTNGDVGIVNAYCSHRLAPLFFGRNEECGLRCPYHGWKFDRNGACVETPNVAPGSPDVRKAVAIKSYPVNEVAGVVWIYMGPRDKQPPFPHFEYTQVPEGHHYNSRWLQRSNWSQGLEGEIDTSHINWLHRDIDRDASAQEKAVDSQKGNDRSPVIQLQETDYGFAYGARRVLGDEWFWRVTQWMAPMFSLIPYEAGPFKKCGGRAWVPIDDNHVTVFSFAYRIDQQLEADEIAVYESGALFPPKITKGTYTLPDGYVIDTYLPEANRENDYGLCREMQRTKNYSGIWGIHDQDRALAENSRPWDRAEPGIIDRAGEHLVSSDLAIVTARRRLLKMAKALADNVDPVEPMNPELFAVRAISKVSAHDKFVDLMGEYASEARIPKSDRPVSSIR